MSDLPDFSDLKAEIEERRYNFMRTDLGICFALTDLVDTQLAQGDQEAAESTLTNAEEAYMAIERVLRDVESAPQKDEIEQKLTTLRTRLDGIQRRLHP